MSQELERRTVAKVTWRLLPYLFVLYIVAYVDRINTSVVALQMRRDVLMDEAAFGFGAGIFFIGYFLFEVPSNLVLAKVGARVWIARIMVVWGVISSAMMFAKSVPIFYAMRFLLGAAEAGFFPGILYYLTRWFRECDRARAVALFMTAGSLAGVVGNPLSGSLLQLEGRGGIHGWQWVFLIEGIPAVLLGVSVLFVLTERPAEAPWLDPEEREWLENELERERAARNAGPARSLVRALTEPSVLALCLVYFLIVVSAYGFEMWLPVIVKPMAGTDFRATLYSAIPYVIATFVMVGVGILSDKSGERRWTVALSALGSAIGFFASTRLQSPGLILAALSLAWCGIKAAQAPFWALSASTLEGSAVAGGLALINSVANLGGQLGPWAVGWLVKRTGNFSTGLFASSFLLLGAGAVVLLLRPRPLAPSTEGILATAAARGDSGQK